MPNFNDIDLKNWRDSEVLTDSLWIINQRDKTGKHSNFYHGNFVPQVPRQLILKYSKTDDVIFDPFLGSGTTAYECEKLQRKLVAIELLKDLVREVHSKISKESLFKIFCGDSANSDFFTKVRNFLEKRKRQVQLAILHPPYADIIKFFSLETRFIKFRFFGRFS